MSQRRRLRDAITAAGEDNVHLATWEMNRIAEAAERAGDPIAAHMWRVLLQVLLRATPGSFATDEQLAAKVI